MSASAATGLAITNPLVKYRALVATRQIVQDPAQLRLALHLQKLYDNLKDYEPQVEYSARLNEISRAVGNSNGDGPSESPPPPSPSRWRNLFAAKSQQDTLALTRKLTSHESAMTMTSPKGLMLHGEVGTGKSMLIDLFADCLPTRKKKRWHFNTFMLETFAKLEVLRQDRVLGRQRHVDSDYSLLWLAKDMIQTSPILFLDEFQMPDRTASKILTNLMTSFFQLGGVLVATSNRMPEELAKAAGMNFPPPKATSAFGWQFGAKQKSASDALFGGQNEFVAFLDVLKARCDVWEMESGQDYRRIESGSVSLPKTSEDGEITEEDPEEARIEEIKIPAFYHVSTDETAQDNLGKALSTAIQENKAVDEIPWSRAELQVYGRTVPVPRSYKGTSMWTFEELCKSTLGPADYITLASKYHTVVLTDVPVLTWLMKNEARRFITLLDALYECRCKLYISAAAGPDDLFFPEIATSSEEGGDAVYPETLSEVYQDATAPFRPNVLTQNPNYAEPDPEPDYTHARLAGLTDTKARSEDQLEDDSPHRPFGRTFGRTDAELPQPIPLPSTTAPDFGKTSIFTGEDERFAYKRAESRLWEMCGAKWWSLSLNTDPATADVVDGWHKPLPISMRKWEAHPPSPAYPFAHLDSTNTEIKVGEAEMDSSRPRESFRWPAGREALPFSPSPSSPSPSPSSPSSSSPSSSSPSSTSSTSSPSSSSSGVAPAPGGGGDRNVEGQIDTGPFPKARVALPPKKISWTHFWGTMKWGPKAGNWGKGVDGLAERKEGNVKGRDVERDTRRRE